MRQHWSAIQQRETNEGFERTQNWSWIGPLPSTVAYLCFIYEIHCKMWFYILKNNLRPSFICFPNEWTCDPDQYLYMMWNAVFIPGNTTACVHSGRQNQHKHCRNKLKSTFVPLLTVHVSLFACMCLKRVWRDHRLGDLCQHMQNWQMSDSLIISVSTTYYIRVYENSSAQWTCISSAELNIKPQHRDYMLYYMSLSTTVTTGHFQSAGAGTRKSVYGMTLLLCEFIKQLREEGIIFAFKPTTSSGFMHSLPGTASVWCHFALRQRGI